MNYIMVEQVRHSSNSNYRFVDLASHKAASAQQLQPQVLLLMDNHTYGTVVLTFCNLHSFEAHCPLSSDRALAIPVQVDDNQAPYHRELAKHAELYDSQTI